MPLALINAVGMTDLVTWDFNPGGGWKFGRPDTRITTLLLAVFENIYFFSIHRVNAMNIRKKSLQFCNAVHRSSHHLVASGTLHQELGAVKSD